MRVFKFLTVESNRCRFTRFKWQMVQCFRSNDSIFGSILHTIKKRIPKSARSLISTMKVLKLLKLLKVSKLLKILKLLKTLSLLRASDTSEAKRARKETALVVYKDPTAIRLETLAEYVNISDSETATDSEPEDSKGNEMEVDIDKAIELKTSAPYVFLSDSESATDSEPEVPKGNETEAEADKDSEPEVPKGNETGAGAEADKGKRMDLDSDHEFDEIFRRSLKKRKKKQKANKGKKVRFNEAGSSNRELAGLHADLFNDFDKALNLDDEMSAAKKGSGSHTGCCRPSVSGFEMDRTGGAKKQQAVEAKVPQQLVMTKPLSRILEGLKSEFTNKKLPEAGKIIGSGVCGGVDECEPSGSNTMVAQAGGANCLDLVLFQAKPLDHEVLNCTLNMNPSEFCTESARNFRRII